MTADFAAVGRTLVAWYRRAGRDLPWRRRRDPYAIWVSEVMLQQTTVQTVLPRYEAFLVKYPDLASLARAREDDVLAELQGMGYYRRFRAMKRAAEILVDEHDGEFPTERRDLERLPGVGKYMSGALAGIAFDRPEPAVDGNVIRVVSRLECLNSLGATASERRRYEDIVREMMTDSAPSELTQALFDLGATVCLPRSPHCLLCPVASACRAHLDGRIDEFPPAKERRAFVDVAAVHALIVRRSRVLLVRRAETESRMPGFWEFPGIWIMPDDAGRTAPDRRLAGYLEECLPSDAASFEVGDVVAEARHGITHHRLRCTLYRTHRGGTMSRLGDAVRWSSSADPEHDVGPLTTVTAKLWRAWRQSSE